MLEKKLASKSALKILIPTDFRLPPQSVNPILGQLGKKRSLDVTLIHVVPLIWGSILKTNPMLEEMKSSQRLDAWASKLPKSKKKYKMIISEGNIAEEISLKAKEIKADFILFEEKKSKNIYTRGISTVAQQIVRYSNKSVFVCKNTKISSVLCAVDGSKSSRNALNSAIQICKLFSSKLTILHALPEIDYNPSGLDEHIVRRFDIEFKKKHVKKMDKFLNRFNLGSLKSVNKIYMRNAPASSILEIAEVKKINLVILGAKGHSLMRDFFIGSTVEKVMPFSPCSLLIVR